MLRHILMMVILLVGISSAHAAETTQQLSASDMKQATEMNKIYAKHMYSSSCMERQRSMYVSPILSPAEKANMMASFQKSCDCLSDGLLGKFNANDVISYVTYMNGSVEPGTKREKPDTQTKEKNAQIMVFGANKDTRKECGFRQ